MAVSPPPALENKDAIMLPTFETERLSLREVTLEDAPEIQACQTSEDQWLHQAVEPEELADAALRIQRYMEHRGPDEARRIFAYVAVENSSGEIVGQVSLSRMMHPAVASLGFGVASQRVGQGYATEMTARMLAFGFEDIRVNRITAEVAIENQPSLRVVEKIGLSREGVARECIFAQGRWWTEAQYARLASEHTPR
jgi:ribosomal-protein-alanine N-acetyltransferase